MPMPTFVDAIANLAPDLDLDRIWMIGRLDCAFWSSLEALYKLECH